MTSKQKKLLRFLRKKNKKQTLSIKERKTFSDLLVLEGRAKQAKKTATEKAQEQMQDAEAFWDAYVYERKNNTYQAKATERLTTQ